MGPWFSATKLPWAPAPPTKVCTWVLWCSRTVQLSALAGNDGSSGSVAEPWKLTVWPGMTLVPGPGVEITGSGGWLRTVTDKVADELEPCALVTVSFGL